MPPPVRLRPIPLFEPKWDKSALQKREHDEPRSFERGFRLRAYSDEEMSFPDYQYCRVPGFSLGEIARASRWPAFTGVDLSGKKRPGNCIFTARVDPATRRRYPVDVRFIKGKMNEVCDQLTAVDDLYSPVVVMVEDNGYQAAIIEHAETDKSRYHWWLKVEPTTTTSETKASAELGLPVLQTEFKHRSWVFPYAEYEQARPDDPPPAGHWARLDYELRNHPLAATSDGVMALWFARQGMELFAGAFAGGTGDLSDLGHR